MNPIGLRVDVDTLRGAKIGVPRLLSLFKEKGICASFFFSVGPDNMGRHLWRLLRPVFLMKMVRTKAASLYGFDILFKGTLWPGPQIGKRAEDAIRSTALAGHEVGLHAWDHHGWQKHIHKMRESEVRSVLEKGVAELERITGHSPDCFAAPAWQVSEPALRVLDGFSFTYRSDCRGVSPFYPLFTDGTVSKTPQIPTTLPTYDELVGKSCTKEEYNQYLLDLIEPGGFNVLTIHAEVEGIVCAEMFSEFLDMAAAKNLSFTPLRELVSGDHTVCSIRNESIAGREGVTSLQEVPVGKS